MTEAIHAAWSPGEIWVAVVADGELRDFAVWRPGSPDGFGDVYRARVTAIVPGMAGAFVEVNGVPGFLPDSGGGKGLRAGAIIGVKVVRTPQGGKGPRLRVEPGVEDGPEGLVRRGLDPLRFLAEFYPRAPVIVDDPALAASLRGDLGERLTRVSSAFEEGIASAVDALMSPLVVLPSGVRLSVYPTPALVAIDVDTGAALTGRDTAARRHHEVNLGMLPDLARQIRLRNLCGAILVDLAGLKVKQRAALGPALTMALAGDPSSPRFLGFTGSGLAEIVRPRGRAPLHELIQGPLAAGLAALKAMAAASRAAPGQRLALRAGPAVVSALAADTIALGDLARVTGYGLTPRSDPSLTDDGWWVEVVHG